MNDNQAAEILKKKHLWPAVLLLGIIVMGALFTWLTVSRAVREMCDEMLQQTRQIAQALNISNIKDLWGT